MRDFSDANLDGLVSTRKSLMKRVLLIVVQVLSGLFLWVLLVMAVSLRIPALVWTEVAADASELQLKGYGVIVFLFALAHWMAYRLRCRISRDAL